MKRDKGHQLQVTAFSMLPVVGVSATLTQLWVCFVWFSFLFRFVCLFVLFWYLASLSVPLASNPRLQWF